MAKMRLLLCLMFSSLLWADILPDTIDYSYQHSQERTGDAENCLQDLRFEHAAFLYKDAQQFLLLSGVEDKLLEFRITLGLTLSEAFQDKEVIIKRRLEELFNKFISNPPPDKIEFESIGGAHEYESFPEAQ